jgi:hypothetical protein
MTGHFLPVPEACVQALAEIEADPLALSPAAEAHVRTCVACAETRVAWLAQEETVVQAPAGYFDQLPDRILTKLPCGPRRRRPHLALWAMAAALLLTVGAGGFLAGRANRTPMVEATLVQPSPEPRETMPDTPFREAEDDYAQLPNLSPEEARRLVEQVQGQVPRP